MRKRLFLFVLIMIPFIVFSQDNRRCLAVSHGDIIADSSFIVEGSIWAPTLGVEDWSIIQQPNNQYQIIFSKKRSQPVEICYRVLPAMISTVQRIYAVERNDSASITTQVVSPKKGIVSRREELFSMGEINKGGRISRGISVGNTHDLIVNSALNLNLEGKLSDDLNIRANITDQNIPYQPEGNTQQLQDFDNVYVEIFNDKFSVAGGDIVLQDRSTHFLRYLKNVQGGMVTTNLKQSQSFAGLSAAKGRFGSVMLNVEEGISGPYQIPPPDGNGFVIVIANSEKVYMDGILLTRGFNYDYVIDYNQAEISFTSNLMITKYSRVRVDFEYAVQDYARSIASFGHTQEMGKLTLSANYYKEEDNRNKSLYRELSDSQKILLSEVGDSVSLAISPGEKLVEYSSDRILYYKEDTLDAQGITISIFRVALEPMSEVYAVQFSDLGTGRGSYIIGEHAAQGRIYRWVGKQLGRYEPYVQLAAPDKKKIFSVGGSYRVNEYLEIYVESAFSEHDKNLFSDKDKDNDKGYALKSGMRLTEKPVGASGIYKLNLSFDTEYLSENFTAIDRFRRVEFERDWNAGVNIYTSSRDILATAKVGLSKDALNQIDYEIQFRDKKNAVNGFQQRVNLNKSIGKFQVNASGFFMNSKAMGNISDWQRISLETFYRGKIQPGYRFLTDHNLIRNVVTDSIVFSANYFTSNEFFLRNDPTNKAKFELAYVIRDDKSPYQGELNEAGKSHFVSGRFSNLFKDNYLVNVRINYRVYDDLISPQAPINSVSGRIDWTGDLIKSVFRSELNYSVSNARVVRREYVFIEVPTGEGTHTWRDENMDGIKDLDEFYEAINFDEKNYIKLYVPSSDFVDAFENLFIYRAKLNFPRHWQNSGGIKAILAKISNTTAWTSNYRTTGQSIASRLVPFLVDMDPAQVLSMKESVRSTFFLNRSNPKFGATGGLLFTQRKFLYTNGFEARRDHEYNLTLRWNITRTHNFKIRSLSGRHSSASDYLAGRNFVIHDMKIGPTFAWQPKPTFRITGTYNIGFKTGYASEQPDSQSTISDIIGEVKIGSASRYMINATLKYSIVDFLGNEFTPLGYEMLMGMQPGNNINLNIGWQQQLINGLQIGVFYEARKPEGIPIIHNARASVSALF